jgi:hypothetical protein
MQSSSKGFRASLLALLVGASGLLAGCEGARESVAAAIRPASAQDVAAALRQQVGEGKFRQAHDDGAAFLADKKDAGGLVAWETAKASAQAGLADDAIRFATLAVHAHAVPAEGLLAEPLLAPVHTDPRLLALVTGTDAAAPAGSAKPATDNQAQATIGAGGVKASAGDVSVELPN